MRKIIVGAVGLLWAMSGILLAEDAKGGKDSLEKIKTLRAGLLVKMPVVNDLFDHEHNGVNTAANAFVKQYHEAIAALNKRIETEDAKTGDAHDKVAVDALRGKLTKFQTMWSDRAQNFVPAWNQKVTTLSATRQSLNIVVSDVATLDPHWVRAE